MTPRKELNLYLAQCDPAKDNVGMIIASVPLWAYLSRKGTVIRFGRRTYESIIYYKKVMFIYAPEYIGETVSILERKMLIHVLNDIISRKGE